VVAFLADCRATRPAEKVEASGEVTTYAAIAEAFGISVATIYKWKERGAPIIGKKPNDLAKIAEWYNAQQTEKPGHSIQTSNHYLRAIKTFSRWLKRDRRTGDDALAHLQSENVETDRRHDRRAISPEEFAKLVEAAENGPTIESIEGPDRAMLYVLAAWTGYRRRELSSLTLDSFDLDGDPPSVAVEACYSKRRRLDRLPLHPAVVDRLTTWLATRGPESRTDRLFPLKTEGGHWRKTAKMMRMDMEAAGLEYENEDGLYTDFHAHRHTFISNLGRAGVPLTTAQKLARHHDPKLTANIYTHLELSDNAGAIESLPSPPMRESEAEENRAVLQATGTDHAAPIEAESEGSGNRLPPACQEAYPAGQFRAQPGTKSTQGVADESSPQPLKIERLGTTMHTKSQVHPRGFEPLTFGSVDRCSIQLS